MPSPIVHTAMGYVIYQIFKDGKPRQASGWAGSVSPLLLAAIGISLLPDVDAVLGILTGDLGGFHNNATHSLVFGLVIALGVGSFAWLRQRSGFLRWFFLALLAYELHTMMDFFTEGRGIMALWPFSLDRYEAPVKLFYGLHWSDGWISKGHVWTLVTELGLTTLVVGAIHALLRLRIVRGSATTVPESHLGDEA